MATPNLGLLNTVIEEIDNDVFNWDQNDWVDSDYVAHPSEFNECGTSYCVAGRIAAKSGRTQLFERIVWCEDPHGNPAEYRFLASGYFLAREDDPNDHSMQVPRTGGMTFFKISNGEFEVLPEDARVIHAEKAAIADLGIGGMKDEQNLDYINFGLESPSVANSLFAGHNTLETIKGVRDRLEEKFNNSEGNSNDNS